MGQHEALDYPTLTKAGFLIGLALFLGGAIRGTVLSTGLGWLSTVFLDLEAIGLLVGFFSPFLFGILLPLTE